MTQPEAALPLPADVLVAIAGRLPTRDVFSLVFCCRGTLALSQAMLAGRRLACRTPTATLPPRALRRCLRLLGRRPCQVREPQALLDGSVANLAVLREWGLTLADVWWDEHALSGHPQSLAGHCLFEPGPSYQQWYPEELLSWHRSVLGRIAREGHADLLRALGEWGLPRHQARARNNWMLKTAAKFGHAEVLRVLWEWGWTLEDVRAGNNAAIRIAIVNGHAHVLELLRGWGLGLEDARARDDQALRGAIKSGHSAVLRLLQSWGLSPPRSTADRQELVRLAAAGGHVSMLEFLREWGLTLEDARGVPHGRPLRLAAWHGHVGALEFLRAWGLTLEDVRADDGAALLDAAEAGRVEVLRLMREWGLTAREARRAAVVAANVGSTEAVNYLREWASLRHRLLSWIRDWYCS